jgi:hypothetical protein
MRSEAKWRGAARMLAFVAGSVGALALTALALMRGLDAAGQSKPYVDFDGMRIQLELLRDFKTRLPVIPTQRIVFLGDSTSMHFPDGNRGVDHRLEAALDELAPGETRHRVFSLAAPGYTQFTQYFLSHRVVSTRPDAVVIAFNLASFSNQWREADRPKLAAWLPARHLGEALRLPLHWIGLATDELLLYSTTMAAGGFEAWRRLLQEQARCVRAWASLGVWLQARSGAPNGLAYQNLYFLTRRRAQYDVGPPDRETPALAHSRLDAVLAGVGPDHPVLRVLRATLDVFRANGIPVYVHIVPLNVEHLERIGVVDREALRRGVESVRRVVLAGGGSLIDVHDFLPDAAFADGGGHLVANETLDAPVIVARRIAAEMLAPGGALLLPPGGAR